MKHCTSIGHRIFCNCNVVAIDKNIITKTSDKNFAGLAILKSLGK